MCFRAVVSATDTLASLTSWRPNLRTPTSPVCRVGAPSVVSVGGGGLSCCHSVFVGVSPGCLCVDQFQLCSSPKRTEPNFLPHTVCLSFSVSFSLNIPVCHLSSFFGSVSAAGSGLSSRLLSRISINKLRLPVCLFLLRPCLIYSFNYQLWNEVELTEVNQWRCYG